MASAFLLVVWAIFFCVTFFGEKRGHAIGRSRGEAFERLRAGERLNDADVDALANGQRSVTPEEEAQADRKMFSCCTLFFGLPGAGIVFYLVATRKQLPGTMNSA